MPAVLVRIGLAALAWTTIGVIFGIPSILRGAGWPAFISACAQWWAWGLLAPLIAAIDRRLPVPPTRLAPRLLLHLPLSVFFGFGAIYLGAAINASLGILPWSNVLGFDLVVSATRGFFYWSWLIYWAITGGLFAWDFHHRFQSSELRAEKMERLFSEARLNALRMQLDPHFLFNTLHAISGQIDVEPTVARDMIEHLGHLLRSSLSTKDKPLIPLSEEMLVLEHYLEIQRIRFGRRFICLWS